MEIQEEKGTFHRPRWELKSKGSPHPSRRWCHTSTIHGGFLYIMGGRLAESAKTREFVYRVNLETFSCESIQLSDNPLMRESHSSGLVGDSMYVLFGINKAGQVLKDCLQVKIAQKLLTWEKKGQNPQIGPRESHMSLVLDDRYILIYGGNDDSERLISQFQLYDTKKESWKRIQKVEGTIEGKVGGTLINIRNQIYLFGGQINDQIQYSNQIYKIQILNYKDTTQQEPTKIIATKLNVSGFKPSARSQFASVAFKDKYLIVIGGQGPNKEVSDSAKLLNDVWAFDTEKQTWEEIVPENSQVFKPRSAFTANVHNGSVIVVGGLVSFKDFRSSDEIFVLNLSNEVEKKSMCNLCKSSFKMIPKQEIQVEKAKATRSNPHFSTGFSTVSAIANTIDNPFVALGTLMHSFDYLQVQKCSISCDAQKLMIQLKNMPLTDHQWKNVLSSYEFLPLIQEKDERVRSTLRKEIRQNLVNYLSYNIKNCCLRLGNEFFMSWINSHKQLEICLINKYGIYLSMNVNAEGRCMASQNSIILQHLRQVNIDLMDLYQNSMTLCVTSLKKISPFRKQIYYKKDIQDMVYNDKKLKEYLEIAFSKRLSFQLTISHKIESIEQKSILKIGEIQKDKWQQQNSFPELFEQIYTYQRSGKALILVYQNNKLMHFKETDKGSDVVFQFHLTKNIQPNLTFSDVLPSLQLITAIKSIVQELSVIVACPLKRERSLQRENYIKTFEDGQIEEKEEKNQPKKTIKTNEDCQNNVEVYDENAMNGE